MTKLLTIDYEKALFKPWTAGWLEVKLFASRVLITSLIESLKK